MVDYIAGEGDGGGVRGWGLHRPCQKETKMTCHDRKGKDQGRDSRLNSTTDRCQVSLGSSGSHSWFGAPAFSFRTTPFIHLLSFFFASGGSLLAPS